MHEEDISVSKIHLVDACAVAWRANQNSQLRAHHTPEHRDALAKVPSDSILVGEVGVIDLIRGDGAIGENVRAWGTGHG